MNNNTTRFSNRVDDYVKYRPSYPLPIISFLEQTTGLNESYHIADIGSGTGILSNMFLANGNVVYGVEPNEPMRTKAETLLQAYEHFISVDGTAENTSLPDKCVDMVTAAQAFHWFDAHKARIEFSRIAKPDAYCVLIWNERCVNSPFEKDYEALLLSVSGDYARVDHRNITPVQIADFFAPNAYIVQQFPNSQSHDFEGLRGRMLSSSYAPDIHHPQFKTVETALQDIFSKHQVNDKVHFDYVTKVYVGQL
jgi:ubiquinone/menaquinone biosynthesis C-methylase UbiE